MCLDAIDRRQRRTIKEHRGYYQVFQLKKESLSGKVTLHPIFQREWLVVKTGKWEQAVNSFCVISRKEKKIKMDDGTEYLPGFHCFPRIEEAISWVRARSCSESEKEYIIREVCIRRIHTFGRQSARPVVVASERKVLPLTKKLKALKEANYGWVSDRSAAM